MSKLRLIFLSAMMDHHYDKPLGLYIGGRDAASQYAVCTMTAPSGTPLLNSFDRRVYEALCALAILPNPPPITPRQIHFLTGGVTEPSRAQQAAIFASIRKMAAITVSARPAGKSARIPWLQEEVEFSLLTAEILSPTQIAGPLRAPSIIEIGGLPLESLIQKSGQITRIPSKWRSTKLRQSERRMATQDALLYEILRGRHDNREIVKIAFASFFDDIELSTGAVRKAGALTLKTARNARADLRKDIPVMLEELQTFGAIRKFDLWPKEQPTHIRIWPAFAAYDDKPTTKRGRSPEFPHD